MLHNRMYRAKCPMKIHHIHISKEFKTFELTQVYSATDEVL